MTLKLSHTRPEVININTRAWTRKNITTHLQFLPQILVVFLLNSKFSGTGRERKHDRHPRGDGLPCQQSAALVRLSQAALGIWDVGFVGGNRGAEWSKTYPWPREPHISPLLYKGIFFLKMIFLFPRWDIFYIQFFFVAWQRWST